MGFHGTQRECSTSGGAWPESHKASPILPVDESVDTLIFLGISATEPLRAFSNRRRTVMRRLYL
jgi:hypothetical protein